MSRIYTFLRFKGLSLKGLALYLCYLNYSYIAFCAEPSPSRPQTPPHTTQAPLQSPVNFFEILPKKIDEKTLEKISMLIGGHVDTLKKIYCSDFSKNVTLPPSLQLKQDQNTLQFSKDIVDLIWISSQSTLNTQPQRQYESQNNFRQALSHQQSGADIHNAILPSGPDGWKKRTLARALLSPNEIRLLIRTTDSKSQSTLDPDTLSLLPDEILYPALARAILHRMEELLPTDLGIDLLGRSSKRLPLHPTDTLSKGLLSKEIDPLYSLAAQSAWARALEIGQKVTDTQRKPPLNREELNALCDEFSSLMAEVQTAKFDQVILDVAKQSLHDSQAPAPALPKINGFNPLDPFKHSTPESQNRPREPRLELEDGVELGECFNKTYDDLILKKAETLSKDQRFKPLFDDLGSDSQGQFIRLATQARQGRTMQLFAEQTRESKFPTPEVGPPTQERTLPYVVEDLDYTNDSLPEEIKQIAAQVNILDEDHSAALFMFLKEYSEYLEEETSSTGDLKNKIDGSFQRFLSDQSPNNKNNMLFLSAIYRAFREEIPEAQISVNDSPSVISNKLTALLDNNTSYDHKRIYARLLKITQEYQPSEGKQPKAPHYEPQDEKILSDFNKFEALRTHLLSVEDGLSSRLKSCAEIVSKKRGVPVDEILPALVQEFSNRMITAGESRNHKIIGNIRPSAEESLLYYMTSALSGGGNSEPPIGQHLATLKASQAAIANLKDAGDFFRKEYDVKPLPPEQQHYGILDLSNVPLIGKELTSNPRSPESQSTIMNLLRVDNFTHYVALLGKEEAGNLCRMYMPLLSDANRQIINQDVKNTCEQTADAAGVTAPHRISLGNQVLIPNSYDPNTQKIDEELAALRTQLRELEATSQKGRPDLKSQKKFKEQKEAQIKQLSALIDQKQKEVDEHLFSGITRPPRVLSVDEYDKEVEGYEKQARDLFKKYAKEMEDLDMFSGGYRDFWYNTFKNAYITALSVPLMASTSLVGEGSEGWKAIKEGYKNDSKVLPKYLDLHDRFVRDIMHLRMNIEDRLGLIQRFGTNEQGQKAPIQDPERDRVFSFIMAAQSLFETGTIKDEQGNDTGKGYGPFDQYKKGAYAGITELGITAATFGIGTAWNVGFKATTRFLGVGITRSLAGRGIARSFAQASRYLLPTNTVGRTFLGTTLRRGLTQSTQVALMNSAFPRTLPYVLEHTPVGVQKFVYGAEVKEGGKHARDYLQGMMEDPWFKFKTDAVYQLFTPFYVSAEARMNAAMMKGYSTAMAAAEKTQGLSGQALRATLRVPTKIPIIKATTISNALSGIPADIYVQYFDPFTGTRAKFLKEIKDMETNIAAIKREIASGKLSPLALADQKEKLAEAQKAYTERLEEPFNQVRSGAVMGAGMSWGMLGVGDPYEKIGILMKYQNSMSPERARAILGIEASADLHTLGDLWQRADQRMGAIWDKGKMLKPNTDAAGSFEKMLEAIAAYNVLHKAARAP